MITHIATTLTLFLGVLTAPMHAFVTKLPTTTAFRRDGDVVPAQKMPVSFGTLRHQVAPPRSQHANVLSLSTSVSEPTWTDAKLVSNTKACPSGKSILLKVEVSPELSNSYKIPGQFLQLRLNKETEPLFLAMSSAPTPNDNNVFEFLVKTTTKFDISWLTEAEAGSTLELSQVMGKGFDLETVKEGTDEVLMLAAGSGIAPFKACIESGELDGIPCRLYYGEWTRDDLSFAELYQEWQDKGIKVVPVLSRQMSGTKSYVQNALQQDGIVNPQGTGALLCGMDAMVDAATGILKEAGVPEERILTNL